MEEGHISIETDPDENLAAGILFNIPPMPSSSSFIFRVPEHLRKRNEDKYEPSIVSIGPLHHGKQNLEVTEDYKKIYLNAIISRSRSTTSLKDILKAVRLLEEEARGCYSEAINLTSDEFVTMMVLDGCFIIELLYRYIESDSSAPNKEETKTIALYKDEETGIHSIYKDEDTVMNSAYKDEDVLINSVYKDEETGMNLVYSDEKKVLSSVFIDKEMVINSDPVFSTRWMEFSIRRDLLLIENQIPFVVLACLASKLEDHTYDYSLCYLLTKFFSPIIQRYSVPPDYYITGQHLLDLLRNFLLPAEGYPLYLSKESSIYTVKGLSEIGVKFRRKEMPDGMLDITFRREGIFDMPCVHLGEGGQVLLVNLLALEQHRRDYIDMFTSYTVLLSNLITSKNDVNLLRNEGIIVGTSEVDERVATDIQSLCSGIEFNSELRTSILSLKIALFCSRPWNKWRAVFSCGYLANLPIWAILPVLGVNAILILTVIQTTFTVLSYFPRISF